MSRSFEGPLTPLDGSCPSHSSIVVAFLKLFKPFIAVFSEQIHFLLHIIQQDFWGKVLPDFKHWSTWVNLQIHSNSPLSITLEAEH